MLSVSEVALKVGAVKGPIEFALQTWFAISTSPSECEKISYYWRSVEIRSLILTVTRVEILIANLYNRNTSQLKPVKTFIKKMRALDLTLQGCFDRLAKDIVSFFNNLQHS